MPSECYQEPNTDIYVLQLDRDLRNLDQVNQLEELATEISKRPEITKLVVGQDNGGAKIDSRGMKTVVQLCAQLHKRAKIKFYGTSHNFRTIFNIRHLGDLYDIYDTKEQAIASYQD